MARRQFVRASGVAATTAPPIALVAYIAGAPDSPTLLDAFTSKVGAAPAVVMWYQDWTHADFDAARMTTVSSRGPMSMVIWEPWDHRMGVGQPSFSLAAVIGGTYDAYIARWVQGAKAYGAPFHLRFAHEMNGT